MLDKPGPFKRRKRGVSLFPTSDGRNKLTKGDILWLIACVAIVIVIVTIMEWARCSRAGTCLFLPMW